MKRCFLFALLIAAPGAPLVAANPALTIYNQNFAVVRETVPLDLKAGINDVTFAGATIHLEPNSVILRDPTGKRSIQILEQNYRNDPVSQGLLLSLFEGKTVAFIESKPNQADQVIKGKIIRSGYEPRSQEGMQSDGNTYIATPGALQPVIEVDGQIQFGLPGQPIFPSLGDDTILKPTLAWKLQADAAAKFDAELAYITSGMSWSADYNLVAPESGGTVDLIGWISMDNQSGKTFNDATIKLIAGDVNKLQEHQPRPMAFTARAMAVPAAPPVSEKAFDEYHLYTLQHPTTLRDRESKQVEFVHASGLKAERIYVYDGLKMDFWYPGFNMQGNRLNSELGTESNTKVAVLLEFKNSAANGLGVPLPKGRIRCYRQDDDKQLEFTGENQIDHTPADETVRIRTGDSFDLVGERTRTDFHGEAHSAQESFEIKLRNHKKEAVEIRAVEHLFRWTTWEIVQKSAEFTKTNAQEIEFRVPLKPDEEKTVTYTVRYSW